MASHPPRGHLKCHRRSLHEEDSLGTEEDGEPFTARIASSHRLLQKVSSLVHVEGIDLMAFGKQNCDSVILRIP